METSNNTPPTEQQVREVVELAIDKDIPEFTMTGNWYEDYGMDSLGAIALSVEVRKQFGIVIPDERMPDIRTGEQLVAVIVELQSADTKATAA